MPADRGEQMKKYRDINIDFERTHWWREKIMVVISIENKASTFFRKAGILLHNKLIYQKQDHRYNQELPELS